MIAFAPLAVLSWFNELRFEPVINLASGERVVVKAAQVEQRVQVGDAVVDLGDTCQLRRGIGKLGQHRLGHRGFGEQR